MRAISIGVMGAALLGLAGCASKYVQAVVRNDSGGPVTLVEVDYPSASFGKELLASGAEYDYRFKILGSGATKISWTDAARQEHSVAGPALEEGEEGPLVVTLDAKGSAAWDAKLHR